MNSQFLAHTSATLLIVTLELNCLVFTSLLVWVRQGCALERSRNRGSFCGTVHITIKSEQMGSQTFWNEPPPPAICFSFSV